MNKVFSFTLVPFVVLVNLFLGDGGLLKAETRPSLMHGYTLYSPIPSKQGDYQLPPLSFYAAYKRPLFNSFITGALIMEAAEESLQPKKPFWKQAGIYGLEFIGAGASATLLVPIATIFIIEGDPDYWHYDRWTVIYAFGNALCTSTCTWGMGRLFRQKGSWLKAALCAGLGGFIGGCYLTTGNSFREEVWPWIFGIGLPASGAVWGFNF